MRRANTRSSFARATLVVSLLGAAAAAHANSKAAASPTTAPAVQWLVTTHSGNDVLTLNDDGHAAVLIAPNAGGLEGARGVAVGPGGDLFVASSKKSRSDVLRFSRDGKFKGVFATGGGLLHPYDLVFGPDGNLYVTGQDDDAVSRYDGRTGRFHDTFVPANRGGLKTVRGITFGPGGDLLVASRDTHEVLRYDGHTGQAKGAFVTRHAGGLAKPIQVHFGPDGNLYVGSSETNAILRYDGQTGRFLDAFVAPGTGGLHAPSGFAFSPADGDLYVASRLSDQVLRYDGHTGKFKNVVTTGGDVVTPEFLMPWTR